MQIVKPDAEDDTVLDYVGHTQPAVQENCGEDLGTWSSLYAPSHLLKD